MKAFEIRDSKSNKTYEGKCIVIAEDVYEAIKLSGLKDDNIIVTSLAGELIIQKPKHEGIPHDATHLDPKLKKWYKKTVADFKGYDSAQVYWGFWSSHENKWTRVIASCDGPISKRLIEL